MMSDACASGDIALVRALIDAGVRLNPADNTILPPLASAAGKNSVDIMSLLLDKGARVNAEHHIPDIWHVRRDNGIGPTADRTLVDVNETALLKAARMNNLSAVELLVKAGADVDTVLYSGIAALQIAVDGGQHELDVRSALHKRQYSGKLAARSKDEALIDEFERETKSPENLPVMNTMGDCVSVECFENPIRNGPPQQSNKSSGRPARVDAEKVTRSGRGGEPDASVVQVIDLKPVVIVETVAEYGKRIQGYEQQQINGRNRHFQPKLAAVLIAAGADINRQDTVFGLTPLMQAIKAGRVEAVKLLIEAGARLDLKDVDGRTAADYAAEYPNADIAATLNRVDDRS